MSREETCVFCGGRTTETVLQATVEAGRAARTFSLLRCPECGLVMTSPRLERSELEEFYRPEYWGRANADDLNWVRRDQASRTAFLERFLESGRILDVGCGLGLFLLALDPKRWDRYGIEVMPAALREARRRLGADRILAEDLSAAVLPDAQFDVITFWDVLEHLPDPVAALRQSFRLLRPGGLLLVRAPNLASYLARRFGGDWYELSLPYHLFHFTPATLARVVEASGFKVRASGDSKGAGNHHAFKHTVLNRLMRLHGPRGGRLRYYLVKPALRPWEYLSTRRGGGSSFELCAERLPARS
ncbi:MAG TPA: class I SAM-dependent methyltransferase [Terriglobia bacterium]|nr:class I SAM-dependent methyltransferase [Terriglobia bacterium]